MLVRYRRLSSSSAPAPRRWSSAASAASAAADAYRCHGHLRARLSPLAFAAVRAGGAAEAEAALLLPPPDGSAEARALAHAYCGAIGFEFMHCATSAERALFARAAEEAPPAGAAGPAASAAAASPAELRNAAQLMLRGHELEAFLGRKWVGLKHYGGSGCEALLPAVDAVLAAAGAAGVQSVVLGQAHRGRLALLVALLGYPARKLFHKLDGRDDVPRALPGLDDVSSHLLVSGERHGVRFSLLANPSHLELVNGAALGKARAQRDAGANAMALLIHGDAAFAGQGSVMESLAMSQTPAFSTRGSVHILTNNLLGFTAAAGVGRSSTYASDAAKAIDAPVLHVDAEQPAEVLRACRLAVAYRAAFGKDVFVDLVGYRRHGHNEVDEPGFTSPALYKEIRAREPLALAFADGVLGRPAREAQQAKLAAQLEAELAAARATLTSETGATGLGSGAPASAAGDHVVADGTAFARKWRGVRLVRSNEELHENPPTGVSLDALRRLGRASVAVPPGFAVHDRLQRSHVAARLAAMGEGEGGGSGGGGGGGRVVDWATAETLAFLSIAADGLKVRLSGQDAERGTFSNRHAVLVDQVSEARHAALTAASGGRVEVHSSLLSELAPLSFEYGYSLESPEQLVLWEAQFGDFANCAQSTIDNFVATSESKWLRSTGLVLLLPHGQDGAGPEHSSARIERFLQLTNGRAWEGPDSLLADAAAAAGGVDKARDEPLNLLVAQPTTPANYYHLLRRQVARGFRKPLVVATPKQLLRLDEARSALAEMGPGTRFRPVLGDERAEADAARVTRVVLCSGKLFYELDAARKGLGHLALIRIEELAPWPAEAIAAELAKFSGAREVVYAQDEPANAGAWAFARAQLEAAGVAGVRYCGRPALATAAAGVKLRNAAMQASVISLALGGAQRA